jgi:hypothetical protein
LASLPATKKPQNACAPRGAATTTIANKTKRIVIAQSWTSSWPSGSQ